MFKEMINDLFLDADINKSGSIDKKEFKKFVNKELIAQGEQMDEKELKSIFKEFDFDGDGKITKENVMSMLK